LRFRYLSLAVAGLASIVLATGGTSVSQEQQPPPGRDELGHVLIEKMIDVDATARATDGLRTAPILFHEKIATPTSVEKVDVVMTATVVYKTSRGDTGRLEMNNKLFPVESPSRRFTTTTVTWAKNDVAAAGAERVFQVAIHARNRGDRGEPAITKVKRLTVVVEMWPAGD